MREARPYIDARCTHLVDRLLHFRQNSSLEPKRRDAACNLNADLAACEQTFQPLKIGRTVHPHEGIDDDLVAGAGITIHHVEQRGEFRIICE